MTLYLPYRSLRKRRFDTAHNLAKRIKRAMMPIDTTADVTYGERVAPDPGSCSRDIARHSEVRSFLIYPAELAARSRHHP
jgi:hypothetical protein